MCCQRVCGSTPGDWGSNNPVFAVSLRRCRTTAYTSSAVPRFTNMLLSPRPFGSRSVVRLGVIDPELRPPLVVIPSVRDTAHSLTARSQSLILSDCVGRSCPQTGAREGLARRSPMAAPELTPPQKSPPPPPTQSPGRPESPLEDTGGAAADSPCAPTPPASHRA